MTIEDDTTTVDAAVDAALEAELESGFTDKPAKPAEKPAAEVKPDPAATPPVEKAARPEYVRITKSERDELRAAAAKIPSYDRQLSQVHGHYGKMKERLDKFEAQTPRDLNIKMPDAAFTKMAKEFPELAELTREEFQTALAGLKGGTVDPAEIETKLAAAVVKREVAALEREHPDWREKINAVNTNAGQQHDPNHPFQKWLASKSPTYQKRINNTESATQLCDAIDLFEAESKAPARPAVNPQAAARLARMSGAIQPRGDGGNASSGDTLDAAFADGFTS